MRSEVSFASLIALAAACGLAAGALLWRTGALPPVPPLATCACATWDVRLDELLREGSRIRARREVLIEHLGKVAGRTRAGEMTPAEAGRILFMLSVEEATLDAELHVLERKLDAVRAEMDAHDALLSLGARHGPAPARW